MSSFFPSNESEASYLDARDKAKRILSLPLSLSLSAPFGLSGLEDKKFLRDDARASDVITTRQGCSILKLCAKSTGTRRFVFALFEAHYHPISMAKLFVGITKSSRQFSAGSFPSSHSFFPFLPRPPFPLARVFAFAYFYSASSGGGEAEGNVFTSRTRLRSPLIRERERDGRLYAPLFSFSRGESRGIKYRN